MAMNPLLKETFVFRPINSHSGTVVNVTYREGMRLLRYAEGAWLPDNGEPDIAFIDTLNPFAYGVDLPDYSNYLWTWLDYPTAREIVGKDLEKWVHGGHEITCGEDARWDKEKHPNAIAYRAAMNKCCEMFSVANGAGPSLTHEDNYAPYFTRELIWIKGNTVPIKKPENPVCELCLNDGAGHKAQAFRTKFEDGIYRLDYAHGELDKAQMHVYDAEDDIKHMGKMLEALRKDPLYKSDMEPKEE